MALRALVVAVALGALVACSGSSAKFRGQFLASCIQSGGNKAGCTCTFDKLENKYGLERMESIELVMSRPRPTEDAQRFAQQFALSALQYAVMCRQELG